MIHQRREFTNPLRSIVQYYPLSMLVSLISSITSTGISLYYRSPYAFLSSMHSMLLTYGFILEFKRLIPDTLKIKNDFDDQEFIYNNQLAALLHNENNSTPSLEIYSSDPGMIGLASGHLRGWDYLELRRKYSRFLFLNAQLRKGPWYQDAIKTINQRTRERKINIDRKLLEQHQFLFEANKKVVEYNLHASSVFQDNPITIDELNAYNHFPDDFKGNLACSNYLPPNDDNLSFDMVRNFDWPGAGELFNRFLRMTYRTEHENPDKPQFVITWTLPTNPGFTATNGHLVLAMNEVEIAETMRRNPDGGLCQFDLFNAIAENCCTLEEIEAYIKNNPPASPWILVARTKNGGGIFEMLPNIKDQPLYRFIKADHALVATNHFQDLPESATISCSVPRFEKMSKAIQHYPDEPWKIAASSSSNDTGHTLIAKWHENGDLIIQSNIANYNSAIAYDPIDNQFHFDVLNVTEYGKTFLRKCENKLVRSQLASVDEALIKLCKLSYQGESEEIAQHLRDIYSQLMLEKSKIALNHPNIPPSLSLEKIERIANESCSIVDDILCQSLSSDEKIKKIEQYENTMGDVLNDRLSFISNRLKIIAGAYIVVNTMQTTLISPSGLDLLKFGLNWVINNISATCAMLPFSVPLFYSLKTPSHLGFYTHRITKDLKNEIKNEKTGNDYKLNYHSK